MTESNRWLLPEGIEEILPPEAWRLEALRRRLLDTYRSWGYELVVPPLIEYLDSLLTGTGNDLDLQTFKLIDQLSGRLLGVRADMTPQVARIDTHELRCDHPSRLCYLAPVLRTRPDAFGGSRHPLQVGAEIYGHAGVESDLEILLLLLETLRITGVGNTWLDLGHVGIYRSLAREARLSGEQEALLFDALQRKAHAEIEEILSQADMPSDLRGMLARLADLNGGEDMLAEARQVLRGEEFHAALADLTELAVKLRQRAPEVNLHFDLAELRGYGYHTGIVFAAYAPGHGEALAQGGRYDDIGRAFGSARPATGFSADLKLLERLGGGASEVSPSGVFAPWSDEPEQAAAIARLRAAGERVVQGLPGQQGDAADMGCDRRLVKRNGGWVVQPL